MKKIISKNKGFTLLVAVVVTSFLLIVSFVLANIALKQLLISSANKESQYAFYNADSGTECALYWDLKNGYDSFSTSTPHTIHCGGETISTGSQNDIPNSVPVSLIGGGGDGVPSIFRVSFPKGCAVVTVEKEYVDENLITTIDSRGYNDCVTTSLRRYERGVSLTYGESDGGGGGGGGGGGAVPAFVQQFVAVAGTPAVNNVAGTSAGNALIVFVGQTSSATRTYTVSDNVEGTTGWTQAVYTNPGRATGIWYKANVPAGVTTVTVTPSGASTYATQVIEVSDMGTTISVDASDSKNESPAVSDNHEASVAGVTSSNNVIAVVAGVLTASATGTNNGPGYTATLTGTTRLFEYQIFSGGVSGEHGAWVSSGTDRTGVSSIVLLSGD
jgi:hypothetical protein